MSQREKLLERLAKLLALARSSNAHEAASARSKADKLMSEHGFTESDVMAHEAGLYELPMGADGFNAIWKFSLVTAAARYHGCEALGLARGRKRKVRIVGDRPDVEKAASLFENLLVIMAKLERLVARKIADHDVFFPTHGLSIRQCVDSFRRGAATGLITKLIRSRPVRFGKEDVVSTTRKSPGPSGRSDVGFRPPATSRELARSETSRKAEQHERIHRKYKPHQRPLDLDDAASWHWYEIGYDAAISQIEVVDEDQETSQKSSVDTASSNK